MTNFNEGGDTNFSFNLSLDAAPRVMPTETDVFEVSVTYVDGRKSQAGNDMVYA